MAAGLLRDLADLALTNALAKPAAASTRRRPRTGNRRHAVLGPAPGTYVLED